MNNEFPPQLFESIDDKKICSRCGNRVYCVHYERFLCINCITQIEIIRGLNELDKRKTD